MGPKEDTLNLHQDLLCRLVELYQQSLFEHERPKSYLDQLGIWDITAARSLKIGYADRKIGLSRAFDADERQTLQQLGLYGNRAGTYAGCITIPLLDDVGRIVQLYGHRIGRTLPQTMLLPTRSEGLVSTGAYDRGHPLLLLDNPLEVLASTILEIPNSIACAPGSGAFQDLANLFRCHPYRTLLVARTTSNTHLSTLNTIVPLARSLGLDVFEVGTAQMSLQKLLQQFERTSAQDKARQMLDYASDDHRTAAHSAESRWKTRVFADSLSAQQYSPATIHTYSHNLRYFVAWATGIGIHSPIDVDLRILDAYRRYLWRHKRYTRKGAERPLSRASQARYLSTLRTYFRWLKRQGYIHYNPAADLELPRHASAVPDILNTREVQQLLAQPVVSNPFGLRDRAFMELLYATGIRRGEILGLAREDIDMFRGIVHIRHGKGAKDRILPVSDSALAWIDRYTRESRPLLTRTRNCRNLFVSRTGRPLDPSIVANIINQYMQSAGIEKSGSCHIFRHSCATHMLEGGADIRYVQEMLGHADIKTTQIYTRVSVSKLQEVYRKSHPCCKSNQNTPDDPNQDFNI